MGMLDTLPRRSARRCRAGTSASPLPKSAASCARCRTDAPERDVACADERSKAQVRAVVEHPFHVVKNLFRHRKVRYRGLAKNAAQLFSLFALANLVLARRLLPPQGVSAS